MYELKVNRNDIKSLEILLLFWVYKLEVKYFDLKFKNGYDIRKYNQYKFPGRFYFRINENEFLFLKSKFSTSKGGSRKGHNVFTEYNTFKY